MSFMPVVDDGFRVWSSPFGSELEWAERVM